MAFLGAQILKMLEEQKKKQAAIDNASSETERVNLKWADRGPRQNRSADDLALESAEREEARYQDMYRPHNQKIMDSIGNNAIVDSAKKSLNQAQDGSEARRKRNLARYGVTETAFEAQNNNRLDKLQNALTRSSVMGDANLKQYERDDMLRNEMINLGRNIATSGQSGLDTAAARETARRNQQKQMDAAHSAQKMQLGASLAALAIFAM